MTKVKHNDMWIDSTGWVHGPMVVEPGTVIATYRGRMWRADTGVALTMGTSDLVRRGGTHAHSTDVIREVVRMRRKGHSFKEITAATGLATTRMAIGICNRSMRG